MLRRRILVLFGSLIVLLVAMAVTSVWLLQRGLSDLEHVNAEAVTIVDQAGRLNAAITRVEIDLHDLQTGIRRHLEGLIADADEVRTLTAGIGSHHATHLPGTDEHYRALCDKLPQFERYVGTLATAQDPGLAHQYNIDTLAAAGELRNEILQIDQHIRDHARQEQMALAGWLRWVVLGMAIAGLLVIDLSVILLLRSASMVLRPVGKLVEAGRQMAQERFDYRARLDQDDEFRELAEVYNDMAQKLQTNEQRKMEMLAQVALTVNHELNNAIATIELQLGILERHIAGDEKSARGLRQIHDGLRRMAGTVESLKHIRRIVLTDYTEGVKMLDLERSVQS